jgi:hypothetical protein
MRYAATRIICFCCGAHDATRGGVMLEDRVITTDQLADANAGLGTYLQIGAGVLARLDPVGLHVLVPRGPVPGGDGDCAAMRSSASPMRPSP